MTGRYLYGDFCSGRVWALTGVHLAVAGKILSVSGVQQLADTGFLISSFGEDELGEVYLVNYLGSVFRIVAG